MEVHDSDDSSSAPHGLYDGLCHPLLFTSSRVHRHPDVQKHGLLGDYHLRRLFCLELPGSRPVSFGHLLRAIYTLDANVCQRAQYVRFFPVLILAFLCFLMTPF